MKQHSLGSGMVAKRTRCREFLDEMDGVVPWADSVASMLPYVSEGRRGRPPLLLETMLCIHLMQQRLVLSDPEMEGRLRDMPVFHKFA